MLGFATTQINWLYLKNAHMHAAFWTQTLHVHHAQHLISARSEVVSR